MKKNKIILGIDPGTNIMGYGLIEKNKSNISFICLDVIVLNKLPTHNLKLEKIYILFILNHCINLNASIGF